MHARENGLTLEALAQRLGALERENERMRSANAELRSKVATLEGSDTSRNAVAQRRDSERRRVGEPASETCGSEEPEARISRRSLLGKAGAAAVGVAAAGALMARDAREANAETSFFDGVSAHRVTAGNDGEIVPLDGWLNSSTEPAVLGTNEGWGPGVEGVSRGSNGTGVKGTGRYGIWGESNQAGFYGVTGRNTNTDGIGVRGVGAGKGVVGESTNGTGVVGMGPNGVYGESSTSGWGAVVGRNNSQTGRGVYGEANSGIGVQGASTSGYGGEFQGGKAQLRLVPAGGTVTGPPGGSHTKGEIYLDSAGALFVCVKGGTPGTWRKVTTTATS